jgi:uncharacterized membrane protein YraQ (UPF0718 family)
MWKNLVDWFVHSLIGLPRDRLGGALDFFIYDTGKIFLLLAVIIFAVSVLRSFFPVEKTKRIIARLPPFAGNVLAALLGIVTPFCSCSAVPLFIGFVRAGIPLGVTFSFLIASPMINEVALVMLGGLFGWKVALIYIGTGLLVAIASGIIIGLLRLEGQVEGFVFGEAGPALPEDTPGWKERLANARHDSAEILRKIWLFVLFAIAIGAFIHGYVPEDFFVQYLGQGQWYSVPLAVLLGVPLYSNAAGVIPIISALFAKGVPLGTALAFMMAVTALSFPEFVILRRVLKPRLLVAFGGVVAAGIMATGFIFNAVSLG